MGALPRPDTPGPWKYDKSIGTVVTPGGEPSDADMEAVAATPERIAREDRVRAYCAAMMRNEERYPDNEIEQYRSAVCRHILHILDGEEGA